jgi:hypothetical protein
MSLLEEEVRSVGFLCVYLIILLIEINCSKSCLFSLMFTLGMF